MTRLRFPTGLLCLALLLGVTSRAAAVFPPELDDKGKFFSKGAIEKANKKIRDIYEKYKKDVVIATLPALSAEQIKRVEDEGRNKFFAKEAQRSAAAMGLNGILVVVVKKPTHLQVHMDPDTQKKAFTAGHRKTLTEKFVAAFKEDDFDKGLADALAFIDATLKTTTAEPTRDGPKKSSDK